MSKLWLAGWLMVAACAVRANGVDTLEEFVHEVKTGHAAFTQTVTSPDGLKKKVSSGEFEFARPNRFRFDYRKPFEQLIVADGQKVWIFDADLNQASSRKITQALGATPAALLAGGSLDQDFDLKPLPASDGLDWVVATPKAKDAAFRAVRIGFRGKLLSVVEVEDAFGQHSRLEFSQFTPNAPVNPGSFVFTVPKGTDLIEQ